MSAKKYTQKILAELTTNVVYEKEEELEDLVESLQGAHHIFMAGAGRSGLAIQAFGNRLMHLGLSVSLVGEITSPHTQAGDLLVIGSGSGETESLIALAKKASKAQIKIALVTMDAQSTIASFADIVVVLPGVSPKLKNAGIDVKTIQPMGSAFEQIQFLTYDGIVLELMDRLEETADTMFLRHADLE